MVSPDWSVISGFYCTQILAERENALLKKIWTLLPFFVIIHRSKSQIFYDYSIRIMVKKWKFASKRSYTEKRSQNAGRTLIRTLWTFTLMCRNSVDGDNVNSEHFRTKKESRFKTTETRGMDAQGHARAKNMQVLVIFMSRCFNIRFLFRHSEQIGKILSITTNVLSSRLCGKKPSDFAIDMWY